MEDDFKGYVRAKLEELTSGQQNQWDVIAALRGDVNDVKIKVAELRTTARLSGIFAGVVAGIIGSIIPKPWK